MKARLGWAVALACGVVCAAEPARAPMDWKSVHPEAIAAWKAANNAPDGVVADAACFSRWCGVDHHPPHEIYYE